MKEIIKICLIFIIASCSVITERLAIKECKFSLLSVNPYDFTFSNLKLDFELKVQNPNKIDAVLDKLDYTFFVNKADVFTGTTGKGIKIPAGKSERFTTTITLEYTKIGDAIVEALRLKKAEYKIKAKAYINTKIGEISYPVEVSL
uniref:Late embryogenesis abundant protein LEA-2 subgroup domain-containing protein n=1 Tax=candidate division WOR-3 bacterium TaxID=2052148 RepID=A0A7C4TFP4_UNCW3